VYLSGIKDFVLKSGFEFPDLKFRYPLKAALRGCLRTFGDTARQKLAVSPKLLLMMRGFLNMSCYNDVIIWAAMLLAFFCVLRKDNIGVGKGLIFDPEYHLTRSDFVLFGGQWWVRLRRSKTNQFKRTIHWVPLVPIPGHPLCPVTAILAVIKLRGDCGPNAPMFCWNTQAKGPTALTQEQLVRAFKYLVGKCGLDWTQYSGHSFRRGGATFAFLIGADHDLIKVLGDWHSDAYLLYEQTTATRRLSLPQNMVAAIQQGRISF